MLSPCFTAYIKDLPYVVLPLLQLRQHHIFYEPLAHIERCLAKRIDDGRHINLHEYPKIVLRVIQHKRNFLAFGCFFSGSEHRNHFGAITKPCRYPSRLASALRMEFLIRRQIFGIEFPKQFIKIDLDWDEKWCLRQRSNDKLQCWLISIVFLRKCTDSGFEKDQCLTCWISFRECVQIFKIQFIQIKIPLFLSAFRFPVRIDILPCPIRIVIGVIFAHETAVAKII